MSPLQPTYVKLTKSQGECFKIFMICSLLQALNHPFSALQISCFCDPIFVCPKHSRVSRLQKVLNKHLLDLKSYIYLHS